MKKEILIATTVAAVLLTGCFNSETGASQRKANGETETHAPAKHEAKAEKTAHVAEKAAPAAHEEKAEAPAPVAEEKTEAPATEAPKEEAKTAGSAEVNTAACAGCHGASFEKKAMGVSKVVKDLSKADIVTALKGYKDGSYGGSMKALMKGQVASLDDAAIEAIANKVGK